MHQNRANAQRTNESSTRRGCVYNVDGTSNAVRSTFIRSIVSAASVNVYKSIQPRYGHLREIIYLCRNIDTLIEDAPATQRMLAVIYQLYVKSRVRFMHALLHFRGRRATLTRVMKE